MEQNGMKDHMVELTCTIELDAGEKLALPAALGQIVGPGRWLLTVRPWSGAGNVTVRRHSAFLDGYAAEDEGLYDDLAR
jgi:hypothetical protein